MFIILALQILSFLFGITLGSFGNVCIFRWSHEQSVVKPRSHCFNCNTQLTFLDMIPVFGWFLLGGKCRYCEAKVSIQYPAIEFICGIMFLTIFNIFGISFNTIVFSALGWILLVATISDLRYRIVPDELIYIGIVLVFANLVVQHVPVIDALLGFFVPSGVLLAIAVVTGGGIGGGDIKLAAILGGLLGLQHTGIGILLGFMISSVILFPLVFKKPKTAVPMVPFFVAGILAYAFYQKEILTYLFPY